MAPRLFFLNCVLNIVTSVTQNKKLMPKFVLKEMESLYVEEMTQQINQLKSNLESLPVQQAKPSESKFPKFGKPKA